MILYEYKNKKCQCQCCHNDAFTQNMYLEFEALKCRECKSIFCSLCTRKEEDYGDGQQFKIRGFCHLCPQCKTRDMNIVKLNLTLSDGSIRSVEEQSFPEWPEMNKIVYGQMQSEVGIMLPIMVEYLSQNLSLAKIEELKFLIIQAICTNVYVKWCYNKQETVRGYINNNDEIDFVAPKIYETIQIIRRVIEIKNNKQAMIQQGDAPEPAMNAVSSSQPSIPPSQ